ncbi:hypothetical protein MSG28_014275 [Choristoneura fumiferana]|uniref:Uncharacterized protein n=1 Tax=Choristoneura fumiferana TaxID=7141 RepID=A0ACC0JGF4_CHOFU|nr:hypothetical protein MSG28_014275 [Choristoneura fumiferana]
MIIDHESATVDELRKNRGSWRGATRRGGRGSRGLGWRAPGRRHDGRGTSGAEAAPAAAGVGGGLGRSRAVMCGMCRSLLLTAVFQCAARNVKCFQKSKKCHDSRARTLPELQPGDEVIALDGGGRGARRRSARVLAAADQPRSYFVADAEGKRYRRNRRHLIKIEPEDASPSSSHLEIMIKDDANTSSDSVYDDVAETLNDGALTDESPFPDNQSVVPEPAAPCAADHSRPQRAAAIEARRKLRQMQLSKYHRVV